uniref:Large ribosomal subunit protein uL23c n=1 Tax=Capsosiphon fulvescens TaxID=205396 RepID=A0A3P8MUM0_9CHLO|nr:ribosomal protein L23 [Capsosiphon fulvescens]AWX64080.1 ribosomal protein L23 [Capsosiphon fulvescens]AYV89997.1 ribosomal protein L23 [Capsosiphon fulvescens]
MIDLVSHPVITEKSCRLIETNQYTFDVDPRLTKPQIKKVFENLFQVSVIAVNTHLPPVKKKRLGRQMGYKTRYKRVIITIKSSEKIPIFGQS